MAKTTPSRKPRIDPVRAALERLAEAQEETQAELRDLAGQVRELAGQVRELAEAQRRTEETLRQLIGRVDRIDQRVDGLFGRDLERHYRDHATSFFQMILRRISVPSASELEALMDDAERRTAITIDEHRDLGLADVVIRGISRSDERECYLVAEVSGSVNELDVVRAQRRADTLARVTGLPVLAVVAGERIRWDADHSARAAGLWRVLDGVTLAPADAVPPQYLG